MLKEKEMSRESLISEEEQLRLQTELKLNDKFKFAQQELENAQKEALEASMKLLLIIYQFRKIKELPLEEITAAIEEVKKDMSKSSIINAIEKASVSEKLMRYLLQNFS